MYRSEGLRELERTSSAELFGLAATCSALRAATSASDPAAIFLLDVCTFCSSRAVDQRGAKGQREESNGQNNLPNVAMMRPRRDRRFQSTFLSLSTQSSTSNKGQHHHEPSRWRSDASAMLTLPVNAADAALCQLLELENFDKVKAAS